MTHHEHEHPEKRRTGQTTGRRYQHGGRQRSQWEQQGGQQMGGQTGQSMGSQTGQQTGGQTGQSMGSQRMGGQQMSGRPTGQQTGGRQMATGTGQMRAQPTQRQGLIRSVTVSDIAATDVVTTSPDAPVTEVSKQMAHEDVGSVVVTEGNRPVGIITDRKIALALGETPDASQLRAADLMSGDVFTVQEGTNVFDLVRKLSDWGIRRAPVVDDQENLRGIVALDDAIVLLSEEFHNVAQIIRKQSPRF